MEGEVRRIGTGDVIHGTCPYITLKNLLRRHGQFMHRRAILERDNKGARPPSRVVMGSSSTEEPCLNGITREHVHLPEWFQALGQNSV